MINRPITRKISVVLMTALFTLMAGPVYAQTGVDPDGAIGFLVVPVILAVFIMGIAAFSLIWKSLFPRKTEWCLEIAKRTPVGSFFLGLGMIVVLLLLVAALGSAGDAGGMVAVLFIALFAIFFVSFKIAAMVEWVGSMIDPMSSGLRNAIYGASGLLLLLVVIGLGWIVLFGFACIGIGAAFMSYLPARSSGAKPQTEIENSEQ
jgi:hypothetical protein